MISALAEADILRRVYTQADMIIEPVQVKIDFHDYIMCVGVPIVCDKDLVQVVGRDPKAGFECAHFKPICDLSESAFRLLKAFDEQFGFNQ